MNVLFVHQNFPGQYLHLARHLGANPDNQVVFITQRQDGQLPGVRKIVYQPAREITPHLHHYLRETEASVLNAQAVLRIAIDLKESGFVPDVILAHNGWGELWFLKDIYPQAPLIGYFEFFYRAEGADVGFNPDDPVTPDTCPRLRAKNIGNLLALDAVDAGQCPTRWQKSLYPERYHDLLHVIHEGVDTNIAIPNANAFIRFSETGQTLTKDDEVITYLSRNLEPYRGFPEMMRSLPRILAERPNAKVVIVGGDETSYGPGLPDGRTFRQALQAELGSRVDWRRVHFSGKVPYSTFINLLQISSVHIYLTYPFVLSWSMLEAMSAGCIVVGSRTAPVEEVIVDGQNGFLVDFFDSDALANKVIDVLAHQADYQVIRQRARQTIIDRYDLHSICLPAHLTMLNWVQIKQKAK